MTPNSATSKPTVAFICTHNSCRSQMAEALAKLLATDAFDACSAGTELKPAINPDAVRAIKRLYGVDMIEVGQHPKQIESLPPVSIVVTMGCGVECPWLPSRHLEDWGLTDPTGGPDELFEKTAKTIEQKVLDLKRRVLAGEV